MADSGTIARNSAYNLIGPLIPIVIGLVTIPNLISRLGMDRFGLLSLLWVFLGYLTFVDLGLSRAVIKVVAEQLAGRRGEEVPQTIWTTVWISGALSLFGTGTLVLFSNYLVSHFFKIPESLVAEGRQSLVVIAFSLPLVILTSVFRGVLEAQNRFLIVNILHAINGTMTYLSPLLLAPLTTRIDQIIFAISIVRFILTGAHWIACTKRVEALSKIRLPTKGSSITLLQFGSWLTISNVISPIMVYFDRFFLGSLIPVSELAYYTTPYEIITRVLILPAAVARTLFPAFTISLSSDPERAKNLLPSLMRLVACLMAVVATLFLVIAKPGLQLWLGLAFAENSTTLLQVFALGIFFNAIANMPHTFLQSAGRPDLTAKIHMIELPIYLICLWLSAKHFGAIGAAWTWSARLILDLFLLTYFSARFTQRSLFKELDLGRLILPMAIMWIIGRLWWQTPLGRESLVFDLLRVSTLIMLVGLTAFYYWASYLRFDERARVLGHKQVPSNARPMSDRFGAVIVTYNPDSKFADNLKVIAHQFEKVWIVDNASHNASWIETLAREHKNVALTLNSNNLGLGKALNQGMGSLADGGFTWIATFDQDSSPSADYIAHFREVIGKAKNPEQIGILAPTIFESNLGRILKNSQESLSQFLVPVSSVITSGSLINVQAFEAVGEFEESFFIDYIDHNFAFRIRKLGYLVAECPGVHLNHQLGDSREHHFLFRKFYATHHSPLRRYYITRNRVQFYKEFFLIDPKWVLIDFNYLVKEIVKILIAESMKWRKFKAIIYGLYDGVIGKMGPYGRYSKI